MNNNIVCSAKNIRRVFPDGEGDLVVLDDVSLSIKRGTTTAIVGKSGSGKSTLLHILGLLDTPSSGELYINEENISRTSSTKRALLRRRHIGFVFQQYHLLPEFSALENIALAGQISGQSKTEAYKNALELLESFGIASRANARPSKMSGGEKQRTAIARAIIHKPTILLCDEPTGNLDSDTSESVWDILTDAVKKREQTLVVVTHNLDLASSCENCVKIEHGKLSVKT